jgi:rhodanese-related sulfurtransferase
LIVAERQCAGIFDCRVVWRSSGALLFSIAQPNGGAATGRREQNLAEVRDTIGGYFRERDALEPVSRKELARRLKDGLVTVLDVRPEDEFTAGHLPQAVNIPLRQLARRLRDPPKNREVITYCRGPYCVLAFEAVALLRDRGFKVRRLEDGYPEWKAAGLPVA